MGHADGGGLSMEVYAKAVKRRSKLSDAPFPTRGKVIVGGGIRFAKP